MTDEERIEGIMQRLDKHFDEREAAHAAIRNRPKTSDPYRLAVGGVHPDATFKTSERCDKIFSDQIKAQKEIGSAVKGSNNPFFKSKYADLPEILSIIKPILPEHSLGFMQFPCDDPGRIELVGMVALVTHASGQWIYSHSFMKPVKQDPQARGACQTYLRRYQAQAIWLIPAEDDDGNEASGKKAPAQKTPAATPAPSLFDCKNKDHVFRLNQIVKDMDVKSEPGDLAILLDKLPLAAVKERVNLLSDFAQK